MQETFTHSRILYTLFDSFVKHILTTVPIDLLSSGSNGVLGGVAGILGVHEIGKLLISPADFACFAVRYDSWDCLRNRLL
jgi:hypothetical protein